MKVVTNPWGFDLQRHTDPPAGDPAAPPATPPAAPQGTDPAAAPPAGTPPAGDPATDPNLQVPADGKYDFGLPAEVQIDQKLADTFSEVGKKYKIPAGAAKELAAALQQSRMQDMDNFKLQIDTEVNKWATETENDPEIGGAKLQENLGIVDRALKAYDGDGKLRELLNVSGMGNRREVVKFLMQVGKTVSEDQFPGGKPPGGNDNIKDLFFSNSK